MNGTKKINIITIHNGKQAEKPQRQEGSPGMAGRGEMEWATDDAEKKEIQDGDVCVRSLVKKSKAGRRRMCLNGG